MHVSKIPILVSPCLGGGGEVEAGEQVVIIGEVVGEQVGQVGQEVVTGVIVGGQVVVGVVGIVVDTGEIKEKITLFL